MVPAPTAASSDKHNLQPNQRRKYEEKWRTQQAAPHGSQGHSLDFCMHASMETFIQVNHIHIHSCVLKTRVM
jgi:hypothetical protein